MHKTHKSIITTICLFFTLSVSSSAITNSTLTLSSEPRTNGKIAFTSNRDGNLEIYVMNPDGTNQTRLTNNSIVDDHAMWSPDGTKLAFVSQPEAGGFAIFQMNMDGTNRVEVTSLSNFVSSAPWGVIGFSMSWSPDGRKIAFQDPYYDDIFVVDVETHVRRNLTNDGGRQIGLFDYHPAWSPDGTTILYASPRYNGLCPSLYAINPDGTNRRLLAGNHCPAYSPNWSPDGTKIVFVQLNGEFVESELRIANSDGENVQIFDGGYPDLRNRDYPRWSPDGRKIAFNMIDSNFQDIEIYERNIDGSGFAQLTNTPNGQNYRPSWQSLAPTCPNTIDCPEFFVRQHYLDFLNREPDPGGWDYWTAQSVSCGNDVRCIHERRIGVSAAFFIELEFQRTGYVVYRMHRAAFGTWPGAPTRANLTYAQFTADQALLPEGSNMAQATINFANAFVTRPEFLNVFPASQSNAQFVNKLFDNAELTPYTTERQQQIDAMNAGKTRSQVLLDLIEIAEFKTREYNRSFVLMEYFGYLRRDPDQVGYDFWLNVLDNREPNNFRGMVCSFITSTEYQLRFGSAITRSNQDCQQP